jgi:hypothetical protein
MIEGDGDRVGIGEIGVVMGEFSETAEEAEVVEAEDFGSAFSLYFQVLAGAHGVIEGTNG